MDFIPDIEPFLTDATTAFQLSGNTLTIQGDQMTFDFDQNGTEEAALLNSTVVRGTRVVGLDDLEGNWKALSYMVTDASDPEAVVEAITLGATFDWYADENGGFQVDMFIPAVLTGATDISASVPGTFSLIGQDSLNITFDQEVPPFLTNTRAGFSLWGGIVTLTDDNTTFDFDGNGTEEPATFEGIMQWYDPVPTAPSGP
jgi:hypothetical protein